MRANHPYAFVWKATVAQPGRGRQSAQGTTRALRPISWLRWDLDDDDRTLLVEPDRRRAIALALAEAEHGDLVVIAGKGHETTQTIGDVVTPFVDREVLAGALRARAAEVGW